jgi:hypothetical protein
MKQLILLLYAEAVPAERQFHKKIGTMQTATMAIAEGQMP